MNTMQSEAIIEKIREIFIATFKEEEISFEDVDMDTDLIQRFSIDSLVGIEILVRIEYEFDIQIDDDDLSAEMIRTMSSIINYINKCKANK